MKEKRLLDLISSPANLKMLTEDELRILAQEIREEIVTTASITGGHVASSLGAVEIILAVHSLINSPQDKFLFDVGHQAYAHKLITGRLEDFSSLRTYGGVSGFPKPSENPHDVHPSGHASDSLSVAVGLAKARKISGSKDKVIALIGDAALAGGMAFEALNYIGQEQLPLVIILNDNEMSISKNVGALVKHLGYMRASSQYRRARENVQERLETGGAVGNALVDFGRNMKESMKQFVLPRSMIFEQLGILCSAPIDGHNIHQLRETLQVVLETDGPVLVHAVTKKGAGYVPAERDPERFHGVGPFDIETGASAKSAGGAPSYTAVFGDALVNEARNDDSIVAITAAMKSGTGLSSFAELFPQRFIDTGIAEEHAVAMASGLHIGGKKPVVAMYSTFLQRAFDQVVINNALLESDVVFAIDRAGLVGEDGPTHHGVFDISYMRMIPNMKVLVPSDEAELVDALHTALALPGPCALRYPRGRAEGAVVPDEPRVLEPGKSRTVRNGDQLAILAFGRMVGKAVAAAETLSAEGIEARVVDMRWAKPLDADAIASAAETGCVLTVEEGVVCGGAGEGVLDELSRKGLAPKTAVLGIPDAFVTQGPIDRLLAEVGLDAAGIAQAAKELLDRSEN